MPNLIKTKRRINSVQATKKITKAMELVATIKLRKSKTELDSSNNYANKIDEAISYIFPTLDSIDFANNKSNKKLHIIVTSNLGLCASYNYDIFKFITSKIEKNDKIIIIGNKGANYFKKLNFDVDYNYVNILDKLNIFKVNKLASKIHEYFKNSNFSSIDVIYTNYINTITFKPQIETLFPIKCESKNTLLPPHLEPNGKVLFDKLLPLYISSKLYSLFTSSLVSELSARRNAMENATDNAEELIDKLKLIYNKTRQNNITTEISEVINGANSN